MLDFRSNPVQFDPLLQLLKIYWIDGSESQFKSSDILDWALFNHKDCDKRITRTLWDQEVLKKVPTISSKTLDVGTLAKLFIEFGVVSVVGVDSNNEEATRKLCEHIAPYCNTIFDDFWTFGIEEKDSITGKEHLDREDTAYSNEAIGPHTDGTYFEHSPAIQVFHCLKAAKDGGDTILVDGFSAAEALRKHFPKLFSILCETLVEHHYLEGLNKTSMEHKECRQIYARAVQSPVITVIEDKITHIRYNPYDRAPMSIFKTGQNDNVEKTVEFYEAYEKFSQIINRSSQALKLSLEPGTVIFIDNFRVLHGRTAFKPHDGLSEVIKLSLICYLKEEMHSYRMVLKEKRYDRNIDKIETFENPPRTYVPLVIYKSQYAGQK